MRVVCGSPERVVGISQGADVVPVALYGHGESGQRIAHIGHQLLHRVALLRGQPSSMAWDFLSLALGVVAADTFVRRDASEDGWTRRIDLTVDLVSPADWRPVLPQFERALGFLSGDIWKISVHDDGVAVPLGRSELALDDCVCLLSGGLDSLVGAIDLVRGGKRPILVSHAYPKEGTLQAYFAQRIDPTLTHFYANADAGFNSKNEISMRCRSLLFVAMGVLAASAIANGDEVTQLNVPENGLISLNPPLSVRRIGSLSTRTTHPYFLRLISEVLHGAGVPVQIVNPYVFHTKGEMIEQCRDLGLLRSLMGHSISCGKWKRKNRPCGRCFPCLIRRAALHAAGEEDSPTRPYVFENLNDAIDYEDVVAVRAAVDRYEGQDMGKVLRSISPLPSLPRDRQALVGVADRGIGELRHYLDHAL